VAEWVFKAEGGTRAMITDERVDETLSPQAALSKHIGLDTSTLTGAAEQVPVHTPPYPIRHRGMVCTLRGGIPSSGCG
jgi:hypothetical protein